MSDVKIEISTIRNLDGGAYVATMKIGDERVVAKLERQVLDGELAGFNFCEETLFSIVLYCCGLDKRFNQDFGQYLNGDYKPPWNYGVVKQVKIAEAVEKLNARTAMPDHDKRSNKTRST